MEVSIIVQVQVPPPNKKVIGSGRITGHTFLGWGGLSTLQPPLCCAPEPRSDSPPSSTPSCTACTWGPPFPRSGLALRSSHPPDTQENRFSSRQFVFLSSDKNTHLNYPLTHSCILERSMPDPIITHCAQQDLSKTLSQYTEI